MNDVLKNPQFAFGDPVERKILSLGSQAKTGQLTLESARLKSDELASAQHWTAESTSSPVH